MPPGTILIGIVCLLLRVLVASPMAVAEEAQAQTLSPMVPYRDPPDSWLDGWTTPRGVYPYWVCPDNANLPPNWPAVKCDTSDEYPPITVDTGYLIGGFRCMGDYCDNIGIGYRWLGDRSRGTPAPDFGDTYWTPYFSEEPPNNARECPVGYWMTGISCQGSYCDNISIQCTRVFVAGGACEWGPKFSEEEMYFVLPGSRYARGIACFGSYCDNLSVKYCYMPGH
jgi:hypothetical protein